MKQGNKTIFQSVLVLSIIAIISAVALSVANVFLKPVFSIDDKLKASMKELTVSAQVEYLESAPKDNAIISVFKIADGADKDGIIILSKARGYLEDLQILMHIKDGTIKGFKIHAYAGNNWLDIKPGFLDALEDYFIGRTDVPGLGNLQTHISGEVDVNSTSTNNGVVNAAAAAFNYYTVNKDSLLSMTGKLYSLEGAGQTPKLPLNTINGFLIKNALDALGYPVVGGLLSNASGIAVVYDETKSYGAYVSTLPGHEGNIIVIGSALGFNDLPTIVFVEFDKETKVSKEIKYLTIGYADLEYIGTYSAQQYLATINGVSANAMSMWGGKTLDELPIADMTQDTRNQAPFEVTVGATLLESTLPSMITSLRNALQVFESNTDLIFAGQEG